MRIFRDTCFLCGLQLEPIEPVNRACQFHAIANDCTVEFTDAWGVAVDLEAEKEAAALETPELLPQKPSDGTEISIPAARFKFSDQALEEIFDAEGLPRLGGASTGKGWTSYSIYQKCPYAWKRRYIDRVSNRESKDPEELFGVEPPARAIGSLLHAFLAVYYSGKMTDSPYARITPEDVYDRVRMLANPEYVAEAWRVFEMYCLYYKYEEIIPLAIEHDVRDPRSGESCRYDLVAFFPNDAPGFRAGTYIVEHKSSGRFDDATIDGWANDGECLGEVGLWKKLGLDHRFGPLRGLIVNILGKQKEPKFHRTIVAPSSMQLASHFDDLKRTEAQIALSKATGVFAKYRGNCIGRWGKCDHWNHCATEGLDRITEF